LSLQSLLSTRDDTIVRAFRSGDDFMAEMEELDPGVVLLDVHMPGSSGLDVLRALSRAKLKLAPVIVTGQGNIGMAVLAMKSGALDFIEKPYNHVTLLEVIDNAFQQLEQDSDAAAREHRAKEAIAKLSPRELDVLMGLIAGRANKVIAFELDISPRTVEIYRANLMTKLEVRSLSEALRIAFAAGLLPEA
jgi:two-component system response regulator FixJ